MVVGKVCLFFIGGLHTTNRYEPYSFPDCHMCNAGWPAALIVYMVDDCRH